MRAHYSLDQEACQRYPWSAASVNSASARSLYAGFSTNLSLKLPYMAIMFACNAANTQALRVGVSWPYSQRLAWRCQRVMLPYYRSSPCIMRVRIAGSTSTCSASKYLIKECFPHIIWIAKDFQGLSSSLSLTASLAGFFYS